MPALPPQDEGETFGSWMRRISPSDDVPLSAGSNTFLLFGNTQLSDSQINHPPSSSIHAAPACTCRSCSHHNRCCRNRKPIAAFVGTEEAIFQQRQQYAAWFYEHGGYDSDEESLSSDGSQEPEPWPVADDLEEYDGRYDEDGMLAMLED